MGFWKEVFKTEPVTPSSLEMIPTQWGTAIRIRTGNLPALEIRPKENRKTELMVIE